MNGIKRQYGIPVLYENYIVAVSDKETAKILARNFFKIHCSEYISKQRQSKRQNTLIENEHLLTQYDGTSNLLNIVFTK